MLTQSYYTTRPERIRYMLLPSGEADIWLRRNIRIVPPAGEAGDGDCTTEETVAGSYTAEEAYIRAAANREEVGEHFDTWFARAAVWHFAGPEPPADPIAALAEENKALRAQVSALTQSTQFLEDCLAEMAGAVYA